MTGYSGTPLAKKLGLKEGSRVHPVGAPAKYRALLEPLPAGVKFAANLDGTVDLVHVFALSAVELARQLAVLRKRLAPDVTVWVSWPKKAAKVPSDVSENTIRALALPLGFVDVKVCAVTDVWSGLKLVVRKELR